MPLLMVYYFLTWYISVAKKNIPIYHGIFFIQYYFDIVSVYDMTDKKVKNSTLNKKLIRDKFAYLIKFKSTFYNLALLASTKN